jgi:hypothetical protein
MISIHNSGKALTDRKFHDQPNICGYVHYLCMKNRAQHGQATVEKKVNRFSTANKENLYAGKGFEETSRSDSHAA